MKEFVKEAILVLDNVPPHKFGEIFVTLRMDFYRKHGHNLICSTFLGADFFKVLLECINGREWDKKEHKGEYEDNFRKLVLLGRANA